MFVRFSLRLYVVRVCAGLRCNDRLRTAGRSASHRSEQKRPPPSQSTLCVSWTVAIIEARVRPRTT